MAYPRSRRSRAHKVTTRTSGNISAVASTAYTNVDTALDITIGAQVGDMLEVGLSAFAVTVAGSGLGFNACSVVSAAPVNNYATGSLGHAAWWMPANNPAGLSRGGSLFYTVVAGDLSSGNVTSRLRYIDDIASGTHTIYAGSVLALMFSVKNLGPPAR